MLTNVLYATVYVTDQDRALTFYTEGLGLEKRSDYPGPDGRFLTVAPAGSPVEIILWPVKAGRDAAADGDESAVVPGPVFLQSDDLTSDFDALTSRGVPLVEDEPIHYPFGVRLTALDPDGNRVELRQRVQP